MFESRKLKEEVILIELYNGDCIEIMQQLVVQNVKVDSIICDPPYDETRAKWDKKIPFDKMWECIDKLITDDGAVVLFGNEPFSSLLRTSKLDWYRYDWKWIKNNSTGFANANYRPMRKYEDIMVFSKANASAGGKANPMKYYPQDLIEINKVKQNTSKRQGLVSYANNNMNKNNVLMQDGTEYIQKYTNYPANILQFDVETERVHPTQKPLKLMEYLVKTYTLEGELVLDFTMGSGSTGVACKLCNRDFIGIEADVHYFNVAQNRLNAGIVATKDFKRSLF